MSEYLLQQLGIISVGLGIFVGINALFFKADDFFSKEFKDDVALRLLCLESPDQASSWPKLFIRLFDNYFYKTPRPDDKPIPIWRKHLSWKCISKSIITSVLMLLLVFFISNNAGFDPLSYLEDLMLNSPTLVLIFLLISLVIPDYFSLLETRYLLKYLHEKHSIWISIALLIADFLLTIMIFTIFLYLSMNTIWLNDPLFPGALHPALSEKHLNPTFRDSVEDGVLITLLLTTTFFTSIWIWLFVLTQFLLRVLSKSNTILHFLKYVFPIEDRPFRSIGIVGGLISTCSYWTYTVFHFVVLGN